LENIHDPVTFFRTAHYDPARTFCSLQILIARIRRTPFRRTERVQIVGEIRR